MKPVTFLRNAWGRKERKTESRHDGSIGTAEGPEFPTHYPPFSTQSELPVITLAMNNPTLQKDLSFHRGCVAEAISIWNLHTQDR
jgi:hypothetical protein